MGRWGMEKKKLQITNYNVRNYKKKQRQSWFASRFFKAANHDCLNQTFLRGVQGGSFFKKRPPGKKNFFVAFISYIVYKFRHGVKHET